MAAEESAALLDAVQDGLIWLSRRGRIVAVNDQFCAMVGFSRSELIGALPPFPYWAEESREVALRLLGRLAAGEVRGMDLIYRAKDGTRVDVIVSGAPLRDAAGRVTGVLGTVKDVTERRQFQERLQALLVEQAALRKVATMVAASSDPDAIYAVVSEQAARLAGVTSAAVMRFDANFLGVSLSSVVLHSDGTVTKTEPWSIRLDCEGAAAADVYQTGRPARVDYTKSLHPDQSNALARGAHTGVAVPVYVGGRLWGAILVSALQGETMPVRMEDRLIGFADLLGLGIANADALAHVAAQAAQQRALAELGQRALYGVEVEALFDEALRITRDQLGVELAAIFELLPDRQSLLAVATAGWDGELMGRAVPEGNGSDAGLAVSGERPIVIEDVAGDERFATPAPYIKAGVRSALSVVIQLRQGPYGALSVHSRDRRPFTTDDVSFLQSVASILGSAIARQRMQEQIRHQALHDPLTGLPNRSLLSDRLDQALARTRRRGDSLALLFIDLDHFKTVNDSLGHRAGDDLLIAGARRLAELVRPGDTIARFGGDEFVLLCEELERAESAGEIADRIGRALEEPFALAGDTIFVSASIGIALPTPSRNTGEALLRDADAAMYRAKDEGRARYEVFDAALRRKVVARMRTETSLRWALERTEFRVHYQPLVSLANGRIIGFESLARWQHPERGRIPASAFVPQAEESTLIVAISELVLNEACHQVARWSQERAIGDALSISVNVAARQLADPRFADVVEAALTDAQLPPDRLRLEITETSLVDEHNSSQNFDSLKRIGVRLDLDDFGTGYSALGSIRRFPLDAIKLDHTFTRRIVEDESQRALVGAIVNMAQALGLQTVAEGIQTYAQLNTVRDLGCDLAQGFLFARPAAADRATKLLMSDQPPWLKRADSHRRGGRPLERAQRK